MCHVLEEAIAVNLLTKCCRYFTFFFLYLFSPLTHAQRACRSYLITAGSIVSSTIISIIIVVIVIDTVDVDVQPKVI